MEVISIKHGKVSIIEVEGETAGCSLVVYIEINDVIQILNEAKNDRIQKKQKIRMMLDEFITESITLPQC